MTLIIILIALGLDFFLGGLERLRNFDWLSALYYWTEKRLAHLAYWDGPVGLIGLLLIPMLLLIGLLLFFDYWSWFFEAIFTLLILIYCLAPEKLDDQLDFYISAVEDDDAEQQSQLRDEMINSSVTTVDDNDESSIIKSALVDAHRRTFAVIFWFLVLGIAGAFLYRIVSALDEELKDIHSGFANSLRDLLNILEWPSSRLFVLGMALAAHLMDALAGWRQAEALSIDVNKQVVIEGGLGALQYRPGYEPPETGAAYWIDEAKSLLNRTLVIWLAVIAIMTLSGKLG